MMASVADPRGLPPLCTLKTELEAPTGHHRSPSKSVRPLSQNIIRKPPLKSEFIVPSVLQKNNKTVLQAWAHMHKHRRKECLHYDSLKVDFLHFLHCFKWQEGDSIFGGSSLYLILGTGVCPLSSMKWCCREFQKSIDVMASHVRGGPGARRSSTCSATKWFCPHTSCPIYSFSCSPNQWVPLTGGN